MTGKEICEKVYEMTEPIANKNGVEIEDIEFVKEGPNHYLRVFIDKEEGVNINDCENVSRALDQLLDEDDFISVQYILEVSSPGIDKVLKKEKDFVKYAGRDVDIKLYKAIDKQKEFTGELVSLVDDILTILIDEEEKTFDYSLVSQVRLSIDF